ncbi:hypothetical protein LINPERHAP1_LOCUS21621 [Linum perenne]
MSGPFTTVADLKSEIYYSKFKAKKDNTNPSEKNDYCRRYHSIWNGCCLGTDHDLLIIDPKTNTPYLDDSALIFNQAAVLLRRVPGDHRRRPLDITPIGLSTQMFVAGAVCDKRCRRQSFVAGSLRQRFVAGRLRQSFVCDNVCRRQRLRQKALCRGRFCRRQKCYLSQAPPATNLVLCHRPGLRQIAVLPVTNFTFCCSEQNNHAKRN